MKSKSSYLILSNPMDIGNFFPRSPFNLSEVKGLLEDNLLFRQGNQEPPELNTSLGSNGNSSHLP